MGCGPSAPLVLGKGPNDGALIAGVVGANDTESTTFTQSHPLSIVWVRENKQPITFKLDGKKVAVLAMEKAIEGVVVRDADGKLVALMRTTSSTVVTESQWPPSSNYTVKYEKKISTVYSATPRSEGQEEALTVEGVTLYEWATSTVVPDKWWHNSTQASLASIVCGENMRPKMVVHDNKHMSVGCTVTMGDSSELIGKGFPLNMKVGAGVDPLLVALALMDCGASKIKIPGAGQ